MIMMAPEVYEYQRDYIGYRTLHILTSNAGRSEESFTDAGGAGDADGRVAAQALDADCGVVGVRARVGETGAADGRGSGAVQRSERDFRAGGAAVSAPARGSGVWVRGAVRAAV